MIKASFACALLLASFSAQAQLYKWVGPDGKVTYSDTPPPKTATRVEQKSVDGGGIDTGNLPYELAQATKNHPVTLYTGANCVPCDDGRSFLKKRGIPFREKTVTTSDDLTRLKQAGGDGQLPVMFVGRNKQSGFANDAWNNALTVAGYPQSNQLPSNYRYAAAEPAAPKPQAAEAAKPEAAPQAAATPAAPAAPAGNAPPGFRF